MWSRLVGTRIWGLAEEAYAEPAGRSYHTMRHVMRLYELADEAGMPYERALDLAILSHDVIYDSLPEKERRSAEWLLRNSDPGEDPDLLNEAVRLVMSTADHTPGRDNRLILLDLHDLGDEALTMANRELLADEFLALNGVGREDFVRGNAAFMMGMADRIDSGIEDAHEPDREAFRRITGGVRSFFSSAPSPGP